MQVPLRLCDGGPPSPIPPKYTTGMGHALTEEGASHMRYCIPLPVRRGFGRHMRHPHKRGSRDCLRFECNHGSGGKKE